MDKRERNDIFRVLDEETLKNSKKDVRSRSFLFPKRILWTAGQVENSRRLLEKEEMQISLAAHEPCILKNEKGEKASILLDYGIEIHGGISLLAWLDSTKRGAKVRVRFGESAAEAMSDQCHERPRQKRSGGGSRNDEHESHWRNGFPFCAD